MKCKNCGAELFESDNFCKSCGAKVIRNRLTFKNLWADFAEQFLNYDNRFLITYLGLFKHPEKVIGSYISGTRKKYVNVLSYLALAITLSGIQIFILQKFYPEVFDLTSLVPESTPTDQTDVAWVYDYMTLMYIMSLPLYALVALVTFLGLKKFNYTEHLVIMTYILSHFSMTNAVILTPLVIFTDVNFYIAANLANVIMMVFTAVAYKRLYPLSTGGILLRSLLFIFVLVVTFILIGLIQFVFMVIEAGGFEEFVQKQKELQKISYVISSAMNWTS
ncbi:MAG: DUF3667 domain-containing protein [Bacteroidota bacterium]